jgi:hypothetical protein
MLFSQNEVEDICNILGRSKTGKIVNEDIITLYGNCNRGMCNKITPEVLEVITKAAKKQSIPKPHFGKQGHLGLPNDFEKALAFLILAAFRGYEDSKKQILELETLVSTAHWGNETLRTILKSYF